MTASASPTAAAPVTRSVLVIGGLAAATVAGLVLAVAIGPVTVPLHDTVAVLFGGTPDDPRSSVLIGTVRVPRALTVVSVGGAGAAGGLFTGGLSVAGRVATVAAGAAGAGVVLGVVLLLSRWVRSAVTLLIIGVMIGSLATALVSLLLTWADPQRAQQFIAWGLGSFAGTTWPDLAVLTPVATLGLLTALASVKSLNALLLGENYARSMGLTVRWARLAILLSSSVLAGASVALACAVASHLPGTGGTVPLNVITSLIGAPVVITVLLRSRRLAAGAVL